MKLNSSHVFSQFNSQVFHSIFTCFYPIVKITELGSLILSQYQDYFYVVLMSKHVQLSLYLSSAANNSEIVKIYVGL